MIGKIIRRDVTRESVTYQAVLEEGCEEARRSLVINFLRENVDLDLIARATGYSIAELQQLQQTLRD
jgi:hypothetical protein